MIRYLIALVILAVSSCTIVHKTVYPDVNSNPVFKKLIAGKGITLITTDSTIEIRKSNDDHCNWEWYDKPFIPSDTISNKLRYYTDTLDTGLFLKPYFPTTINGFINSFILKSNNCPVYRDTMNVYMLLIDTLYNNSYSNKPRGIDQHVYWVPGKRVLVDSCDNYKIEYIDHLGNKHDSSSSFKVLEYYERK